MSSKCYFRSRAVEYIDNMEKIYRRVSWCSFGFCFDCDTHAQRWFLYTNATYIYVSTLSEQQDEHLTSMNEFLFFSVLFFSGKEQITSKAVIDTI